MHVLENQNDESCARFWPRCQNPLLGAWRCMLARRVAMDLRGRVLRSAKRGIPLFICLHVVCRLASQAMHAWHGGFWRANAGRGLLGLYGIVACPAFEASNLQALGRGNLTLLGAHHSTAHLFLPGGADSIGVSLLCHNQASSAGPPLKPFKLPNIIFVQAFGGL